MVLMKFADRLVSYEQFINDLAARLVYLIKCDADDPEFVCQRKAFAMFGRRNVERWRQQGLASAHKRVGKVEYLTAELRLLQRREQDYFKNKNNKQK